MYDFRNQFSVSSISRAQATFSDHIVLQKPLYYIRECTLHEISDGAEAAQLNKSNDCMVNDVGNLSYSTDCA